MRFADRRSCKNPDYPCVWFIDGFYFRSLVLACCSLSFIFYITFILAQRKRAYDLCLWIDFLLRTNAG